MQSNLEVPKTNILKNSIIRDSFKKTRTRRKSQICKQYEIKVDKSNLNKDTVKHLGRLFLEARWFYNSIIASENFFDHSKEYYKIKEVEVKVEDKFETRKLQCLSSQMKQGILARTEACIRGLSAQRENGHRIGALKFKSAVNSIPLNQYNRTWRITNRNHVHIQKIKQRIRVRGLVQIPKEAETTSAVLVRKHGDYYLHVSTFHPKRVSEGLRTIAKRPNSMGLDLGVKYQLTTSNGIRINYCVEPTIRLWRLQRRLSNQQKDSKNWCKTREKLLKEHYKLTNRKKDIKNKLVHKFTHTFSIICCQNDLIKEWQKKYGRRILNTAVGGITCALKQKAQTLLVVPRFYPSTQICSRCNSTNRIGRGDRIYQCLNCGLHIDRDLNASKNIEKQGLIMMTDGVPTEQIMRREFTPADIDASTVANLVEYLNHIPRVTASFVEETGSPTSERVAEAQLERATLSCGQLTLPLRPFL